MMSEKNFPSIADAELIERAVDATGACVNGNGDESVCVVFEFRGRSAVVDINYGDSLNDFANNCEREAVALRKDPYVFDSAVDSVDDDKSEALGESVADALDNVAEYIRSRVGDNVA